MCGDKGEWEAEAEVEGAGVRVIHQGSDVTAPRGPHVCQVILASHWSLLVILASHWSILIILASHWSFVPASSFISHSYDQT